MHLRDVQFPGDLHLGKPAEEAHVDHLLLPVREAGKQFGQGVAVLRQGEIVVVSSQVVEEAEPAVLAVVHVDVVQAEIIGGVGALQYLHHLLQAHVEVLGHLL